MKELVRSLIVVFCVAGAHAAQSEIQPKQFTTSHVPSVVRRLSAIGQPDLTQQLVLTLTLPLQHTNELEQLLRNIYDPASPQFHRFLSAAEFADRFGPSQADYNSLIAFCQSHNLVVDTVFSNRTALSVRGAVKDVAAAFNTHLRTFQHPSENRLFYAPETEPAYDAPVTLLRVHGLDNFDRPKPHRHAVPLVAANRAVPQGGSGPSGLYIGKDFRNAYAPGVTLTGNGQTLALVEFDGYYPSDVASYTAKAGIPAVPVQTIAVNGFSTAPSLNNGEVSLDIQVANAMAPGLEQILVYEADPSASAYAILNKIAADNRAKQISCSWTWSDYDTSLTQVFQQYAAQGQSFLTASGDSDAYAGTIDQPADHPYVTSVGGTSLSLNASWSGETVWSTGAVGLGTGGGISTRYPIPNWQASLAMGASGGSSQFRNIPDVAMVADNVLSIADNGSTYITSGTSIAAPLWAAFVALANEQAAANGQSTLGFLNPALYSMGNGGGVFHDIVTGNNTNSASPNRFFATSGYDLCTGWGSPTGQSTITALLQGATGATLDHFAWSINSSAPTLGSAISVKITAQTASSSQLASFSGPLTLSAQTPAQRITLAVTPTTVVCKKGAWTGTIQVNASAPGIVFVASDAQGHIGTSSPVDVAATLKALATPSNRGVVTGGGTWVAQSTPILTAIPDNGWRFLKWQDGNAENPRVITMPPSNVTYTATFALIDSTPPTIRLATKSGNYRATTPLLTVKGAAADKYGIQNVNYRVNGSDWAPATGTTNWNTTVTLAPGTNTIEAFSTDTSSNQSAIARAVINFIPTATISMNVIGKGVVSPNLNGQTLDVGKIVTITATPGAGQIFDSWNTGATTAKARFTVVSDLAVTAIFVPSPFTNLAGVYNGLWVATNGITSVNSGYITMTVRPSGTFSAKLVNGSATSFTGQFRPDGTLQQAVSNSKTALSLNLNLTLGTDGVAGQIIGPNGIAVVQADRAPWNARTNPAPFAGKYTLDTGTNNFGTLTVAASGAAKLVGALPDKTRVTQATTVSINGDWPLYQSLYNGTGALIGWGQIANGQATNDLVWITKNGAISTVINGTR